jgi:mitogen-activated protein kinase kinase kinase
MAACFQIGEGETLPTIPTNLSAEARAFLSICLTRDQNARPSAEALVSHPWLALQDCDRLPHDTS